MNEMMLVFLFIGILVLVNINYGSSSSPDEEKIQELGASLKNAFNNKIIKGGLKPGKTNLLSTKFVNEELLPASSVK